MPSKTLVNIASDGSINYGASDPSHAYNSALAKMEGWGVHSIILGHNTGEGVISGLIAGTDITGYKTSRTIIKTLDLISEGEIEGLVSGEYQPVGSSSDPDVKGQVGWKRMPDFQSYGSNPENFLRSIYLNDVPITTDGGYYNFQNVEVAFTPGSYEGILKGDPFLNVGESNEVQKTRIVNERLLGPDGGVADEADVSLLENPFIYNNKTYRILNKELEKIKINLKIPSLLYTKQSNKDIGAAEADDAILSDEQIEQLGESNATTLKFYTRFRPIYKSDFNDASSSGTTSKWYPDASFVTTTIFGLIRSGYIHPIEIDLTTADYGIDQELQPITFAKINTSNLVGWEFEITRLTFDSIQANVQNQSYIDSITEIFSADLSYPNSAIMALNFNAQYFSQIPTRAFDVRLQKVKIPVGYHPIQRSYQTDQNQPVWNGRFQDDKKWTDNPAWVYYDLLTNRRYGLGKFINDVTIDKWTLFEISKFCDTLVPDGNGALEPRFTCNAYINTREEAYKVLQDFASVFRGILYYGLGNIHAVQDRPRDPIAQFTNSNVENGNFQYSSSGRRTRSTVVIVRYNDKDNGYKPALEYVEDAEGIRKYGYIEKEVTAFACTSKTQAIRLGKWILLTELYETELCNFTTGPEASLLRPGDVIKVFDTNRFTTSQGGRVIRVSASEILFDRIVDIQAGTDYNLSLTTPTYFYDSSIVDTDDQGFGEVQENLEDIRRPYVQHFLLALSDSDITRSTEKVGEDSDGPIYGTKLTYSNNKTFFDSTYGELKEQATWSLLKATFSDSLYTVLSVKESGGMKFLVETMMHRPDKYAAIEEGMPMDDLAPPGGQTIIPPNPGGLTIVKDTLELNGSASSTQQIKVTIARPRNSQGALALGNTVGYRVYVKRVPTSSGVTTFLESEKETGDVPKDEYIWRTAYIAEHEGYDPTVFYLPPSNNHRYIVRVFSVNGASMLSDGYFEKQLSITDHFPVRDIRIHSLRQLGSALDEAGNPNVVKPSVIPAASKETFVTWEVDFPLAAFKNLNIVYRISIHEANTGSSTPLPYNGNSYGYSTAGFDTHETIFHFTFEDNAGLSGPDAPYRNFDLVVRAVDEDDVHSSGPNDNFSTNGWDIIEIDNPRPDNYHLTPRTNITGRPGAIKGGEKMTTEQWIDANGNVRLDIIQSEFTDLAGGFLYLSHHPFSGQHTLSNGTIDYGDFTSDGEANNYGRIEKLCTEENNHKRGQFQILEIPFDMGDGVFRNETCCEPKKTPHYSILAHPNSATNVDDPAIEFDFQNVYHLAVKFYDSFDRAVKEKYEKTSNDKYADWDHKLWLGFVRHHVDSQENILSKPLKMYHGGVAGEECGHIGNYLADLQNGEAVECFSSTYDYNKTCYGLFSCPIFPTKYYSANAENGFKYWIRINVNGQWEGNGISAVKALTWGDVMAEYGYDGFWEYACTMKEDSAPFDNMTKTKYMPNATSSITRCRFRQGQWNPDINTIVNVDDDIYYSPEESPPMYVTGSIRVPNDGLWPGNKPSYFGPKAGVPWEAEQPDQDRISSVNEFGSIINGKDRPLYGYRRYRVYFDEEHLPPEFDAGQLASYSVIGMNAWNGPYEAWPDVTNPEELMDSILFAKDGVSVYTHSVRSWMQAGDLFENIPGVWNHHPAGFGQGFGGLKKTQRYFDVHLGRMIDDSYLNEGFFAVVTSNDYSILEQEAAWGEGPDLHYHAGFSEVYYVYDPDGDGDAEGSYTKPHPYWQGAGVVTPTPEGGDPAQPKMKMWMDDAYNDGWDPGCKLEIYQKPANAADSAYVKIGEAWEHDNSPSTSPEEAFFDYTSGYKIRLKLIYPSIDYPEEQMAKLYDSGGNLKWNSPNHESTPSNLGGPDVGFGDYSNNQLFDVGIMN